MDIVDLDADPLRQLAAWLEAARSAGEPMPEAMTIATATADGIPAARVVILRGLQPGLVFFTDLTSDKGAELAANPQAAAVLHWLVPVHRQVRVTGPVEPVSEQEASEYWRTRPAATRRNAAASHQSRVIASQAALRTRVQNLQLRHPAGTDLPRPSAGAASGCFPPASNSGRNPRTACTTGSATGGQAITGRPNGCPLKDPSPETTVRRLRRGTFFRQAEKTHRDERSVRRRIEITLPTRDASPRETVKLPLT